MTVGDMLSQMGIGNKQLTDRYSDYHSAPAHEPFYSYDHPVQTHVASSKHGYSGGKKNNAAMSALTLLAFLFFLHILQQCLRDHMQAMSTAPIMIMTAGREGEEKIDKTADANKIDKAGVTMAKTEESDYKYIKEIDENMAAKDTIETNPFTKIHTAEHVPGPKRYQQVYENYRNRSSSFPG